MNKILLAGTILFFFGIFLSIPLLHNHTESVVGADDCPAHVLEVTLISVTLFLLWIKTFLLPAFPLYFPDYAIVFRNNYILNYLSNRAPPVL